MQVVNYVIKMNLFIQQVRVHVRADRGTRYICHLRDCHASRVVL